MSRLPRSVKYLLIVFAVLAVLAAGGVLVLNHWLGSPEMHTRLEKELSLALKMPVKFKTVHISLRGQLAAEGVTIPERRGNFLEAASFSAKADFSALLHGRFALAEIQITSPKFFLVQRANGEWKGPDLPPELQAELDARQGAKKVAKAAHDAPKPTPAPAKKTGENRVGAIRFTDGSVELVCNDGKPFLSALGVTAHLSDVSDESVEGYLVINRLVWHGNFTANNVHGTVSQSAKGVIIQDVGADIGGGTLSGGYSHKADQPGPPFNLKLACKGVDVSKAAMDAAAPPPHIDGILTGSLEMRGLGDVRKTFIGKADFTMANGTCREIEWVNQLSSVLQYEDMDLAAFKIKELKGEITFMLDKLTYKSLTIDAPPLRMVADGESRFDGTKLRLQAQLLVDSKFLAKRTNVAPQFGADDGSGMRAMPFTLAGSFAKPKQNLIERLTGTTDHTDQAIKLGLDALNNLKDERQKKPPAAAATAPGGAPAPIEAVPAPTPRPTAPEPLPPSLTPAERPGTESHPQP